ncbi:Glycosyltransferase, partial [Klenkia terrae]|jgi:GT2 family glycosyltransferase
VTSPTEGSTEGTESATPVPGEGVDATPPQATANGLPEPAPVAPPGPRPRLRARVRETVKQRLPEGSRQRLAAKAGLSTYRELLNTASTIRSLWTAPGLAEPSAPTYRTWLKDHEVTGEQSDAQRESSAAAACPVTVQVVILPGQGTVDSTLDSLRAQSWAHWTAVVCRPDLSAASTAPVSGQVVDAGGVVVDSVNTHVQHGSADLVVLLEAGDRLRPDCLYQVAAAAHRDPLVDIVTWDDDVLTEGRPAQPLFRPSWSPEMLLGAPYVGRAFAIRRARFLAAGGLRVEAGQALHWDLLLRSDCEAERVTRVTRVLSSVPARPVLPALDAVHAVQQHLDRNGVAARAESAGPSRVRLRWTPQEWPSVSIVIPTRHNRPMLSTCLPSLARTDYPAFEVVIVDNGGQTPENEAWYAAREDGFPTEVLWWHEQPFNYSAVNNAAVRTSNGEVLVFLNDDTEVLDPLWLQELVGWATQPDVGVAGLQLTGPDGAIQHAGVVLGMGGFADHVFEGMAPGSDSIYGPTDWYRNVLAVTGACLAVRREVFDHAGGFDERFVLCGSDVALGLDTHLDGKRNVCSPYAGIRHLESATRGTTVPTEDFFASYWKYNTWLFGGDPYWSPSLSLSSREPQLRSRFEPSPGQRLAGPLGRDFTAFRQRNDAAESRMLADMCRALPSDVRAVEDLHAQNAEPFQVRTVNWFIPDIDSPFYGGINSALRIADELARNHGVENRFVVWGSPPDHFVRSALAAAFPSLADSTIVFFDGSQGDLAKVPKADVGIATLWVTAYALAHAPNMRRKFYLIQDFEPMFYPASTLYALAEETYKLGLYGLCNTDNLRQIYAGDYGGRGMSFAPAVDDTVFHARWRHQRTPGSPVTVFVYARPGHWRNCWEMASLALEELKRRMGDGVRIVTAGAWAAGQGADEDIKPLGLLPYRATGELYRNSDVGLALTVSKHPSYLPLELMACGVPVVAFDNPWGHWILEHEENSLLAKRTADDLADQLERLCRDQELRERLSTQGLQDIAARHGKWDPALAGIYDYLCDPEGKGARG